MGSDLYSGYTRGRREGVMGGIARRYGERVCDPIGVGLVDDCINRG